MKKVTCMITGCAGFIGSHLTAECLKRGWYVLGVDKLSPESNPSILEHFKKYGDQFTFVHKDINELTQLYDFDVIFNLCAESHVDASIEQSHVFIESNIKGPHNLLELIRTKRKRPLFFQMGTDESFGDCVEGSHKETDILKPSNPYSFSKASADLLVQAFYRTYGIQYQIVRATNNWGIMQNPQKLIPRTCRSLLLGNKIELHNNGTPYRMWLHVEDCVNAILTVFEKGNLNEIYNISGGYEQQNIITVQKIINCWLNRDINSQLSKEELNEYIDFNYSRPGQDVRYSLDDTKLRSLGWKTNKVFDFELPSVVKYYKERFIW